VFIDVIKSAEEPKTVLGWGTGIVLKWLRFSDRREFATRLTESGARNLTLLCFLNSSGLLKIGNWRLSHRCAALALLKDQVAHDMVEAGPHLMNRVTEN